MRTRTTLLAIGLISLSALLFTFFRISKSYPNHAAAASAKFIVEIKREETGDTIEKAVCTVGVLCAINFKMNYGPFGKIAAEFMFTANRAYVVFSAAGERLFIYTDRGHPSEHFELLLNKMGDSNQRLTLAQPMKPYPSDPRGAQPLIERFTGGERIELNIAISAIK